MNYFIIVVETRCWLVVPNQHDQSPWQLLVLATEQRSDTPLGHTYDAKSRCIFFSYESSVESVIRDLDATARPIPTLPVDSFH